MAKRKLTMNKRPERSKQQYYDDSCLKLLFLLPFLLIKRLFDSIREGLSSETPEHNKGCGCLMILLMIGAGYCYYLLYNHKGFTNTEDNHVPVELLKQFIEKKQ